MSEPFVGEIRMFGGNFAPRGWALCDGQLLPINQNSALFSILGTTYGGDGRSTFGLPDLRGRSPMHAGRGPGLSPRDLGAKVGAESVTLSVAQLPAHGHGVEYSLPADGPPTPAPEKPTAYNAAGATATMASNNAGGGQAVPILPPVHVVNFIVALVGLYPSRS